ncbi:MAG: trypsin-like serine protease [bacterium]|nr:trypsin-like serine protease [bacterium]
MSDFIDDQEPSAPKAPIDPFQAPEPVDSIAPSMDIEPDWEPQPPHHTAPAQPNEQSQIAPPATTAPPPSQPASQAAERQVRPIEPIATSPPSFSTSRPGLGQSAAPVAPPERTHYYPASRPLVEPERRSRWPLALLAFGSGLFGALLVGGGLFAAGAFGDPEPPPTTAATVAATAPAQTVVVREVISGGDATGIATAVGRKVVPSIVTIEVGTGNATTDFQGFGSGSGVVFSADGIILTNHHVIEGATTSRVIFQDGRIYEAEIVGSDELTDLAVLRVQAEGLTPIEFGATADLQIGDRAIAVGNPLGLEGGASLTVGVVSAFDREVNTGDTTPLFGMLQTDAPITNGSSGGALVNAEGKLIGITTAIGVSESGAEGIGFATPVEVVNRIVGQIIETGDVAHAFLGVSLATSFTIQDDGAAVPAGAVVVGFADGVSAAADAGLQVDDVILTWNGNEVRTINDLINGIRGSHVGESIMLEVDRGGKIVDFEVILGQRPEGV